MQEKFPLKGIKGNKKEITAFSFGNLQKFPSQLLARNILAFEEDFVDVVVDNGGSLVFVCIDFGGNQSSVSHRKAHKFVRGDQTK